MKVILIAVALLLAAGLAQAASHSEAPIVSIDQGRTSQTTDVYVFEPKPRSLAAGVAKLGSKSVGSTGRQPDGADRSIGSSISAASSSSASN